ncbi:MAG: hypothetical protein JWR60_4063 [Polaromonas sp.]|nr:hypothetical protein [Polaromonas sp.]
MKNSGLKEKRAGHGCGASNTRLVHMMNPECPKFIQIFTKYEKYFHIYLNYLGLILIFGQIYWHILCNLKITFNFKEWS